MAVTDNHKNNNIIVRTYVSRYVGMYVCMYECMYV